MKSLSRVQLLATPWTAALQAPPPLGFSRQEYWSGVPLPSLWGKLLRVELGAILNLHIQVHNKEKNKQKFTSLYASYGREGTGDPLQYSWLENLMGGEAW